MNVNINPGQGTSRNARRRRRRRNGQQNGGNQTGQDNQSVQISSLTRKIDQLINSRQSARGGGKSGTGKRVSQAVVRGGRNTNSVAGAISTTGLPDYFFTVTDPAMAPPSRVPSVFAYPTAITKMTFTGFASTNSSGNCYLACRPGYVTSGCVMVNSTAAYADGAWDSGTNVVSFSMLADRGLSVDTASSRRLVGCSFKCKYIGTANNASGSFVAALSPNTNQYGFVNPANPMMLRENFYANDFTSSEIPEVIWVPREDVDMDFISMTTERNTSCLCIAFIGGPASGVNILRWEANLHFEYVPSNTNYLAYVDTVEADIRALPTLQRMINAAPQYVVSKASDANVGGRIKDSLKKILNQAADVGIHTLAQAGAATLKSYLGKDPMDAIIGQITVD